MEDKLQKFLDEAFAPYGDFPSRKDVVSELHANLLEKYNDLVASGKTEDEAYQSVVDSLGDVSEIMEQVPHTSQEPAGSKASAKGTDLRAADLTDSNLAGKDFSGSALMDTNFDRTDLSEAKFKGSALKGASFVGANLTSAVFTGADLGNVNFENADLSGAKFSASALKGASFTGAKLINTEFKSSDLTGISFEGLVLEGSMFSGSSLKTTSFKNTDLRHVSFHHSAVKYAIFEGATMDKLTYALLKGAKANLADVIVL
ncbi:MAG: pentapeptide repeat-containing protein [Candidatus Saccharibacteria bacterium]|nr:pentapeptide repeat-containing protein [Candidatus Saccharibacteria bacterium]